MNFQISNYSLPFLCFFTMILLFPKSALSEFDQDSLRKPPIGRYLLIRPCIFKGSIVDIGSISAKLYVEKWIKGSKIKKTISAVHATSFLDRKKSITHLESIKNQPYIFILRGAKRDKNRRLLIRDGIYFKVENDSIFIPKTYFAMTRNIEDNTRELSEKLKKEGIRISVSYFEFLVRIVNEYYIRDKKQPCFRAYDNPLDLDLFATLVLNDLKSEICEY